MKRLQTVAVVTVVVALACIPLPSSADKIDDMRRDLEILNQQFDAQSATRELLLLDFKLQSIAPQIRTSLTDYSTLIQRFKRMSVREMKDSCNTFLKLRVGQVFADAQRDTSRVVKILERAQALIERGGVPPERLAETLQDGTLPAMRGVLDEEVQIIVGRLARGCKKAR